MEELKVKLNSIYLEKVKKSLINSPFSKVVEPILPELFFYSYSDIPYGRYYFKIKNFLFSDALVEPIEKIEGKLVKYRYRIGSYYVIYLDMQ